MAETHSNGYVYDKLLKKKISSEQNGVMEKTRPIIISKLYLRTFGQGRIKYRDNVTDRREKDRQVYLRGGMIDNGMMLSFNSTVT